MRQSILITLCAITILQMATAGTTAPSLSAARNAFAMDTFKEIAVNNNAKNVIYSPASIQACMTLPFFGAEGQTATELRNTLHLGAGDKQSIAQNYGDFITCVFKSSTDGPQLTLANRIYVNQGLEVKPQFNEIAVKNFQSGVEQVNFANSAPTVKQINSWVEQQTNNKIQNLLSSDAVNAQTSSILVNAIYFKANWTKQFSDSDTHKADFSINSKQNVQVDMMYNDDNFKYGEISNLDAKAIELPYKNSEISMLILLPNKVDGLQELEKKVSAIDLNQITGEMSYWSVELLLPKFKIEFDIDLKQSLQNLGIKTAFADNADLSGIFTTDVPQKISDVKHKAFIDVNEAGSEAAAATYIKIVPMSLNLNQKTFVANHPFAFWIRSKDAVYFAGHVVSP